MAEPTAQTYLQGQPLVDKVRALTATRLKVADPETLIIGSQALDQTFIEEGKIDDSAMLAIYAEASGLPALDEQESYHVVI